MAATYIQTPDSFKYAMTVLNRIILKEACQQHTDMDDRDQFVQAVFQSFVANGGADIIKQLVAIKHNANQHITDQSDDHHDIFKDEECKQVLEQDWFLFINQFVNFGRPTPADNGVFTHADQVTHDDGEGVEFTESFDFFLYKQIMKIRGLPTMSDQGLGNAIQIRHDLVNLIIQHFVQTTFTNQINTLKDLVDLKDQLEDELSELKRSLADDLTDPKPDPAPKRHKPNGDSPANGDSNSQANGDSNSQANGDPQEPEATAMEVEPDPKDAQEAAPKETEAAPEVAQEAAHEAAQEAAPEVAPEVAQEAAESFEEETEVAKEDSATTMEVEPDATGPKDAQEAAQEEVAQEEVAQEAAESFEEAAKEAAKEAAPETNPWVEICDQHNTIMSNINPKQWEKKNRAKFMRDFLKKLVKDHGGQPNMGMSLVRAIRDSSGYVDPNILMPTHGWSNVLWDQPLFTDVNDEEPNAKTFDEIMVTFCDIIKDNWEKIQEALRQVE